MVSTRNFRCVQGYTLIELVVVVGIISFLAAVLVPVFSRVREKGRQSYCVSNLHQLGLATQMYMADNDGQRPARMETLKQSGHVREKEVCLCPDDASGNWGGIIYEEARPSNLPPEQIKYSYTNAFDMPDWEWSALMRWGPQAGIMVCQLHGEGAAPTPPYAPPYMPVFTDYEGITLRLQIDGAVVIRHIQWEQLDSKNKIAHQWQFFCDDPQARLR